MPEILAEVKAHRGEPKNRMIDQIGENSEWSVVIALPEKKSTAENFAQITPRLNEGIAENQNLVVPQKGIS